MILEVAVLNVKPGESARFEAAFLEAQCIITSMKGYISHELQRCIEIPDQYLLLVRWRALQDHTKGFRKSQSYLRWKELLHAFYSPFPTVEHYEKISILSNALVSE